MAARHAVREERDMDPDATLNEIRELVKQQVESDNDNAARLAELIDGLDGWLARGGHPPQAWLHPRTISQDEI